MAITTTEETRAQYRNRARQLNNRLSLRTGCPVEELCPMALVQDLLSRTAVAALHFSALAEAVAIALPRAQSPATQVAWQDEVPRRDGCISKATFRMYKASLWLDFSEGIKNANAAVELQQLEEAMAVLEAASQCGYSKRGHSGSGLKQKKFSESDFF